MKKRKHFIDNIKWITQVLVILYHVIYIFNCSGVVSNINIQGIKELDAYCVFVYPWIMSLLFVLSGVSARYALDKKSNKEFLKDRVRRILIPSIVCIFLFGWICGYTTDYYNDIFMGNTVPGFIKYIVYCLIGIGPLWYLHVIFLCYLLVILIKKIDKLNWVERFFRYYNLLYLLLMIPVIWFASMILNMPLVTVYRLGIYILMFIFGYYVVYREDIQKSLSKYSIPLIVISIIMGVIYVYNYYGINYTDDSILQNLFTNSYLWITILGIIGISKKYLDFKNKYTEYMKKNTFAFYILHYYIVLTIGFILVTKFDLPFVAIYIIILLGTCILLPLLTYVIRKIPVLNKLILGEGYGS